MLQLTLPLSADELPGAASPASGARGTFLGRRGEWLCELAVDAPAYGEHAMALGKGATPEAAEEQARGLAEHMRAQDP